MLVHATTATTQTGYEATKNKKNRRSRVGSLLRKASSELGTFWTRIRSLSEVVLAPDDGFDDLFETSDSEGAFEKLSRVSKPYSLAEEEFLQLYRKHKSLEKMYEQQQGMEARSSTTVGSDLAPLSPKRNGSDNQHEAGSTTVESVTYEDLDMRKLREQLESQTEEGLSQNTSVGEKLWCYRRSAWLTPTKCEEEIEDRIHHQSLAHIPRDALPRLYINLVDRGRSLKHDKYVNLQDLTKIMNAGWIAEEKWDRAAKGLP